MKVKQQIRHNSASALQYTGLLGSISVDLGLMTIRVHDAQTVGGFALLNSQLNLSDLADVIIARDNLGLTIGVDVQAHNANLDTVINGNIPADWITAGTFGYQRLPLPTYITPGVVEAIAPVAHKFVTAIGLDGVPILGQPAASDITGLAASATTDTTNANNISAGQLAPARGGAGGLSGLLKAVAGVVSAAVSDVDYVLKSTYDTAIAGINGVLAALSTTYTTRANNLSDLASVLTARTNLGLGSAAVRADTYFQTALGFTPLNPANNLSEVLSQPTAQDNIGIHARRSANIATANGGSGNYVHGFTLTPNASKVMFMVSALCTSTDGGWAVNQTINLNAANVGSGTDHGIGIAWDATKVYYQINNNGIYATSAAGGFFTLDLSKWVISIMLVVFG